MNNVRVIYPDLPSIRPRLSKQVIVKYDAWKHWVDEQTGEDMAYYKIRFTVVPTKFSDLPYDPTKCYMTILEDDGEIEKTPFTYMFATYSSDMYVGKTQVEELQEAIHNGTVMLKLIVPGYSPDKHTGMAEPVGKPFLELVAFMEKHANEEYERINGAA